MKFKKPLSLLLAAVLLCAFAVPLLETPALAADKEIHEVATVGVYKWMIRLAWYHDSHIYT